MTDSTTSPKHGEGLAPSQRRVLVAEDNDTSRRQMQQLLQTDDLIVDTASNGAEALHALGERHYSLLVTDLKMPKLTGLQLLEEVQKRRLPVGVIVMTAYGSIDEAVNAMRMGATDFLTKPVDFDHLRIVVNRALRERSLQDEVANLREQLRDRFAFHNVLSKSPKIHAIFELIGHLAQTTTTVLIEGETGTGKEMFARAIHQASAKRTGPFVAINCAALPETLLESELFGHEKGAFTNALTQRKGRFELADGGTLLLDEVGDVPMAMQAKLLRVLQERTFERVGGAQKVEVDVRIIAATNRSLRQMVTDGQFREDLYYRLNVVKIDLPPLRERPEDIALLATHFTQKYARPGQAPAQISPAAMEALLAFSWPGNIRQLENAIERACVTAREGIILPENLPSEVCHPAEIKSPLAVDITRPLPEQLAELAAQFEEKYLRQVVQKAHGSVTRCAEISGLSRRTISDKLAHYKIDRDAFKYAD
jgi:DNA-binding NtrC family response regulator